MPKWNEATYFKRAEELPANVQRALKRLYALREANGIRVEFSSGQTPRLKVHLNKAGSASVLMPAADDGTLFVPFQFHQGNSALVEPLGKLIGDRMGYALPSDWRGRKPYIPAELWVPHVDALTDFLKSLAEDC
ncbi:MAG: hypothetical protein NDI82_07420 [Anaeromyxobacteraceae bacterium]|nr:hypothetical protein [Anaeromyxobacteraceae bacterium]